MLGSQAWSYVGSQYLCGNHEGYSGETIEWLNEHVVAKAITAYQPDIVLFLAGTNDFFWPPPHGSRSPAEVATRLRAALQTLYTADTNNATVLVSTVTAINQTRCKYYHTASWHPGDCPDDMQANIAAYNRLLPGVVQEQKALGRDVRLVVQPTSFIAADYWLWGIHFNSSGFEKIAGAWHSAIVATDQMRRAMGVKEMGAAEEQDPGSREVAPR